MKTEKVILSILAGVAAGAVLGVMFAPDKGSNTRKKFAEKSEEYLDGLEEKFNEFIDGLSRKFDAMKEEAPGAAENGKPEAAEAGTAVSDAAK